MQLISTRPSGLRYAGRYLSLTLVAVFLAGQIPYACTTYFCTMEHKLVNRPEVAEYYSAKDCHDKICEACRGVLVIYHTTGVSKPNCLRVDRRKKDVLDFFSKNDAAHFQHNVVIVQGVIINEYRLLAGQSPRTSIANTSPPSELPKVNKTLRI